MKFFIAVIVCLLSCNIIFAQKNNTTINVASHHKIDSLNQLSNSLFLTYPDSARQIAAQALILSERSQYFRGKGRSFLNIGVIYWSQSYYVVSLFYLKSALAAMPADDVTDRSDIYRTIGRTYADLKNNDAALFNLNKSLRLAGNDTGRLAEVFSEKAYVYNAQQKYDEAASAAKYALKLNRAVNAQGNIAVVYARLANIYFNKKNYASAAKYNDIAYRYSVQLQNRRLRAKTDVEYALINNATGKYDIAIKYAEKGILLADSLGVMDAINGAYNAKINSYELKQDLKQALAIQKKLNIIRDSLSVRTKLKTIELVQNYYDLNQKIAGIALIEKSALYNKATIRSQKNLIAILASSILLLMVILLATGYFYKQKKLLTSKLQAKHTELLAQQKLIELQTENLQKANGLKDKLLAVIGHDLRTPVANLTNIISMFDTGYLTPKDVHDLMKDISPIVKGAELTLSNLVDWAGSQIKGKSVDTSKVDVFLLGVEMEQTFSHSLLQKNIEFVNRAFAGQSVLADENHLKVILRNLISNAIKFTGDKGSITLATMINHDEFVISIQDSGKGMSAEEMNRLFSLNTHFSYSGTSGEKGTGIGLLLCKELAELNGGRIGVTSTIGKGSSFYLNLPLINTYA